MRSEAVNHGSAVCPSYLNDTRLVWPITYVIYKV